MPILLLLLFLTFITTGCETFQGARPNVTVSHEKVYGDDQVLKMLAERRRALRELERTIQGNQLQEIRGIRQATKATITIKGNATADALVAAPDAADKTDIALPTALSVPGNFGLAFESLLRKAITRDQLLTGLQLLYLGDSYALEDNKRLMMVRFDISINDYLDGKAGGKPRFAQVGFHVTVDPPELQQDIRVYTLAPDYSSIVVQDSLTTSQIESLAVQAAGRTGNTAIQGAGNFQRALEESLLSVIEQPLQFAIYDSSNPLRFAFAFGPRRHITMRSWINPARIFGNKYRVDYTIEPGPRDVYAILVVPCEATAIRVNAEINDRYVTQDFANVFDKLPRSQVTIPEVHTPVSPRVNRSSDEQGVLKRAAYQFMIPGPKHHAQSGCRKPSLPQGKTLALAPVHLFPKLSNSFLITTASPLSSETEVWIGNVAVARENVTVIGRYEMKVTIPPDEGLKALLKAKTKSVPVYLVTGTMRMDTMIDLMDSDPPDTGYTLAPATGVAGMDVKLVAENSTRDLSKATKVVVGGMEATIIPGQGDKGHIVFRIPKPASDTVNHPVSVEIHFNDGDQSVYLPSQFTYVTGK